MGRIAPRRANGSLKSAPKPTGKPVAPLASKAAPLPGKSSGSKSTTAPASPPPGAIKELPARLRERRPRTASSSRSSTRTGCTPTGSCPPTRSSGRKPALRQDWHGAKPIIRLFDVTSQDTTSTSETPVRDIEIHGGGNNWYIDVPQPPRQYRVDIGYLSRRGEFFVLARSNVVTPPKAGSEPRRSTRTGPTTTRRRPSASWRCPPASSRRGSPELKRVLEERLRRPLGRRRRPLRHRRHACRGASRSSSSRSTPKLIVYGRTDPNAHVTLQERAGQAAAGRHLHDAVQPAGQPADHPGRRHQRRRRRGADDRPGRRAQHQAPRPDDPRPDERNVTV